MEPTQAVLRLGQRRLREDRVGGDEGADQEVLGQGHEAGAARRLGQRSPEDHRRQFQKTKEIISFLFMFVLVLVEIHCFQVFISHFHFQIMLAVIH